MANERQAATFSRLRRASARFADAYHDLSALADEYAKQGGEPFYADFIAAGLDGVVSETEFTNAVSSIGALQTFWDGGHGTNFELIKE